MAKSTLIPPITSDSTVNTALSEIYANINKLQNSFKESARDYREILDGSVRALYDGRTNSYRLEGKSSKGWVSIPAQLEGIKGQYANLFGLDNVGNMTLNNSLKSNKDLTIDVVGDIELNADGGDVIIKDGSDSHFLFDCDNTAFRIYDDTNASDYFTISVISNGRTTLSTTDDGGALGHLTIAPDGDIFLNPVNIVTFEVEDGLDGIQFKCGADYNFAQLGGEDGSYSVLRLNEAGGLSTTDFFEITVEEHGETTITTIDNAGSQAHLTLDPDGAIDCNPATNNGVTIDANCNLTTTANNIGLFIDYDKTGDAGVGQTIGSKGVYVDLNSSAAGGASGGHKNRGFETIVTGGTTGLTVGAAFYGTVTGHDTNRGLYLIVDDGGTDITLQSSASQADYCSIASGAAGATTITTVDSSSDAAHLLLDIDGAITLDTDDSSANGGIIIKDDGTTYATINAHHSSSYLKILENGGSGTDYFQLGVAANGATEISTGDFAGSAADFTLDIDGDIFLEPYAGGIKIIEDSAATGNTAGYGQLWVKDEAPNELYFTTDAGDDIQITDGTSIAGGGGTSYWHQMVMGYKLNIASASVYYTFNRLWNESWTNSDSSPNDISRTDSFSAFFIAPRAGTITNIKIQGTSGDTGFDDPFKFYLYKAPLSTDEASGITCTAMFNTSSITPPTTNRTWKHTEDFSSSNTFAEDDLLYVWFKKDSHSANQDLYFLLNISGEYS